MSEPPEGPAEEWTAYRYEDGTMIFQRRCPECDLGKADILAAMSQQVATYRAELERVTRERDEANARWTERFTKLLGEAQAAEAELERLRAQIREFRQKCDPGEDHVLVTPDELAAPAKQLADNYQAYIEMQGTKPWYLR